MALCRWDDDSDVYVYEGPGENFSCHVAKYRRTTQRTYVPIGGPYDGKTFVTKTRAEMIKILEMLRDSGYCVPQSVLAKLNFVKPDSQNQHIKQE